MSERSVLLLAGEASGDYHAASLVRELRRISPDLSVTGIGGEKLAAAGMELLHHYRDINTIGLSEGFGKLRNIVAAYNTMKRELRSGRHRVFIPVDYPDVNLRLCRIARDAGVAVCYYISPQVWAWRKGRIKKIARRVDRMLTIFPFEEKLYLDAGVNAQFVGHTMVRDIPERFDRGLLRAEFGVDQAARVIALVPGSRPAEIHRMLPIMADAARLYLQTYPDARFLLPLAGPHLAPMVSEILASRSLPVTVLSAEAVRVMAASDSGLVTSGTATLQAALAEMPHVVAYVLDPLTWWVVMNVVKPLLMDRDVHVAIANVLAIKKEAEGRGPISDMLDAGYHIACPHCGRPLFVPELLQSSATPENLAQWLVSFSADPLLTETMIDGFRQIRAMLTPRVENPSAAHIILAYLDRT
jgi:lipid-A-disaccharide synthase